ncbi:MAG: mechanosensitive ion channel domain-containing protein [Methyloglobulus sp.]|nr:mechanosensitive ion channel [Methyloglobulus sp.]
MFLLILFVLIPPAISAERQAANASPEVAITKALAKSKIDAVNGRQDLDAATKTQILSVYQAIQENLENIEGLTAKTVEFEVAMKTVPDKIKKMQKDVDHNRQKLAKFQAEDFARISDEELEQRLILEKDKLSSLDSQESKLEQELILQNQRPLQIRQEIILAQQALEDAQKKLQAPLIASPLKLEAEAKQLLKTTQIDARIVELKMLSVEGSSSQIRIELLKTELQLVISQKSLLTPVVTAIENLGNERRQQQALKMQAELTQAERSAGGKHPIIQQTTRENIQYSRDLQTLTAKIEVYNAHKNKIDATASEIEADFKSAEKKISLAGLSPVLGKILREQRRNLANQDQLKLESETIQNETALTSLEQFKIDDKLKLFADLDVYLKDLISQHVDKKVPADDKMMIQAELRVLLNNQKELLSKLSSVETNYLHALGDLDFARQQMLTQAKKYADYLDERLLWVPSSSPIRADYLSGLYDAVGWLCSPTNWLVLIKDIAMIAWDNWFLTLIALIASLVLPMARSLAKRELVFIAEKIEKIYTDNFYYTLKALGYTLVLVIPLPLLVYFSGWFLGSDPHVAEFSKAVGLGLRSAAISLFGLQFFYRFFAANGIAVRHFQWQPDSAKLLHKQAAWLRFVIVIGIFIINCSGASTFTNNSDTLGRLALIGVMIAVMYFLARVLNPTTGLLRGYIKNNPDDWFSTLRFIWYPLIISVPLAVIGFAVAGYYLSALELQQKLIITLRLIFAVIIVHELVIRWLTLVNRQLALKNIRQKRKTALTEKTEKPVSAEGVGGDDPVLPIDEHLIDIPTINAQTIKLLIMFIGFSLIVGFWMIWRNILPAFSFLEHIVLWQHLVTVDNQESYQPITLTNLLMAGLYVFIMVVSVRNFSGIMELLVFSRLSIAAGGRYAVNQLARYLIISIGFICIANELGGSWSQVQWLVAALSVGLGFGLQEIFANLVSGIILLFERPIRVGDTVTISSVTGKVSRIQMRATTLIDPDQKELIIPNKTFITSQLVNWTLSDATTRIVIPIKIAYGSNVDLAHKMMLEVVRSTPNVLEDPAPSVVLTGFGDNTLDFSVRVYVGELANRLPVTHALHVNLEKILRENNMEPFLHEAVNNLMLYEKLPVT